MPRKSPFTLVLSEEEKQVLSARSAKYTLPYFEVVRAKMILLAAEGFSIVENGQFSLDSPLGSRAWETNF